jgi:hypothetical protein
MFLYSLAFWAGFAAGFTACLFAAVIKAWLAKQAADIEARAKAEVARVEIDIEARL